MFGPLGVITPYPGLSSLWPSGLQYEEIPDQGLWQLAAGVSASINVSAPGVLNGPSTSLSKDVEALKGIDTRCKVSKRRLTGWVGVWIGPASWTDGTDDD